MTDKEKASAETSRKQVKLSTEVFDRLVEQAIARIPLEIRRHLDNLIISVQPHPSRELLAEIGFSQGELLFGIFSGVPLTERSPADPPLYPDTIYIFQEPLEAFCLSHEELIREIEITVVHEIAHFIGFDDDELESLGYG
jgi:predicted Zn-dependent protease with MMP-like domain